MSKADRPNWPLIISAIVAVLLVLAGLLTGPSGMSWPAWDVAVQIRLPRVVLAFLVGSGLGLSGAVLQGALRNPLADPGLLGIGGGAALGAVLVFYWGLTSRFAPALPLGGLAGAGVVAVLLLRSGSRSFTGNGLIMAGLAATTLSTALLALALALAPNPFALAEITSWLMGSFANRTLTHVVLAAPPILVGGALLLRLGPGLDALSLGEETARTLGRDPSRTLLLAVLGTTLTVGAGAAISGGIGFVGLIVPHLLRPFVGQRPSALLAASAAGGGALLLAADLLTRHSVEIFDLMQEPPVGVLTALIGAPFLIASARRAVP